MTEQASTALLARPATRTEGREGGLEQRIWHESAGIVNARMAEARQLLAEHQRPAGHIDAVRLAMARQTHLLSETDTDSLTTSQFTANQLALTMLESPFVAEVLAEKEVRGTLRGPERARKVGVLSRFNHNLATAMSCMPPDMTEDFAHSFFRRTQDVFRQMRLPVPDIESIRTRVAGMSREAAFARALRVALPDEWSYRHATTTEDLQGIDVIVTNGEGQELNMDLKTHSAYTAVLSKLFEQRRLSAEAYSLAITAGYARLRSGDEEQGYFNTYIVDADQFGPIENFAYRHPDKIVHFVEARLEEEEQRLQSLGEYAIKT